jgi:hypothetical protein
MAPSVPQHPSHSTSTIRRTGREAPGRGAAGGAVARVGLAAQCGARAATDALDAGERLLLPRATEGVSLGAQSDVFSAISDHGI